MDQLISLLSTGQATGSRILHPSIRSAMIFARQLLVSYRDKVISTDTHLISMGEYHSSVVTIKCESNFISSAASWNEVAVFP